MSRRQLLRIGTSALALALVLAFAACDAITDIARDLSLSLSTDRQNIRAGQLFEIRYDATGGSLIRIVIDAGDGSAQDVIDLFGAQTASGNVNHTYAEPGTYEVVGVATEFDGRSRTARMTLVIAQ